MPRILDVPVKYWRCPSCGVTDRTQIAQPHTQFHRCPALGDIDLALEEVPAPDARTTTRHRIVLSEDYIGARPSPVAAVALDRPDGSNDLNVFPGPATGHMG